MRLKFFMIPAALISCFTYAQNDPTALTGPQETLPAVSVTPSSVTLTESTSSMASTSSRESIMDYKSVYEAATLEEEVQMATTRFDLTKEQQNVWTEAASDRRQTEKQFRDQLEVKSADYSKDATYRELRTSQNSFYETINGYLSPAQKQKLEVDRTLLSEKQKRLAKLPPPPPAPTITITPVDSVMIKESEKKKVADKKSKKKKKSAP